MAKINPLNLDELTTPKKVIILDKFEHEMVELTVQEFIDRAAAAEKLKDDTTNETVDQKVIKLVELIHDAFPTISKDRLGKMPFNNLLVILDYTNKAPEQIEQDVRDALAKQKRDAAEGNA